MDGHSSSRKLPSRDFAKPKSEKKKQKQKQKPKVITLGDLAKTVNDSVEAIKYLLEVVEHLQRTCHTFIITFEALNAKGVLTDDDLKSAQQRLSDCGKKGRKPEADDNSDQENAEGSSVQPKRKWPYEGSSGHAGPSLLRGESDRVDHGSESDPNASKVVEEQHPISRSPEPSDPTVGSC